MPPHLKTHFNKVVRLRDALPRASERDYARIMQRLTALLDDVDTSDAFKDHFASVKSAIVRDIAGNPDYMKMIAIYPLMNEEQKQAWLQEQVNRLAVIQSRCGIKIPPALVTFSHWGAEGDLARIGFNPDHDHAPSEILLNMDVAQNRHCALSALSSVFHEQWHQFHNILAREEKFGRIGTSHPLYKEAAYFAAQWHTNAFVKTGPAYRAQLDERYATLFGDDIKESLRAKIAGAGKPIPPAPR